MRFKKVFLCALLVVSAACSSEKPPAAPAAGPAAGQQAANQAPSAEAAFALELTPSEATRQTILFARPSGFNFGEATLEWLVNGNQCPNAYPDHFNLMSLNKGDTVQLRARVKGREFLSNIVDVKNSPPEISKARFVILGDTLSVAAETSDRDGDEVTVQYEWTRNGEPAGEGKTFEGLMKRGDKIIVMLTPFDGETKGKTVSLTNETHNMPPVITEHKNFSFGGNIWRYQVKASDPDGDPLAYSLKDGPKDMTIGPDTGLISWKVPDNFAGTTMFTVMVKDGQGGEASYAAKVTIKGEAKK